MRERLFKGFHPDENGTQTITLDGKKIKGEWVFGSLIELGKKKYICFADECHNIMDVGALSFEVIPETIGQFTGLLDKNGNKIFEGDIILFSSFYYNGKDMEYKGVVKWSDMNNIFTRFMIWHDNENEYYGADGAFELDMVHYLDNEIEIIGNIHDNPELLSGV